MCKKAECQLLDCLHQLEKCTQQMKEVAHKLTDLSNSIGVLQPLRDMDVSIHELKLQLEQELKDKK